MPLSGYPINTKYASGDTVFAFRNDAIMELEVAGWRVDVDNPSGDDYTGRQIIQYWFTGLPTTFLLKETQLYSSKNHLKSYIRGDYFNRPNESGSGGSSFVQRLHPKADRVPLNWGSWTDFAGFDLRSGLFRSGETYIGVGTVDTTSASAVVTGTGTAFEDEFAIGDSIIINDSVTKEVLSIQSDTQLTCTSAVGEDNNDVPYNSLNYIETIWQTSELIFDGANLQGATMQLAIDTLAEFKAVIKSYDNYSTLWTDGGQILRSTGTGTVATTSSSKAVVGTVTAFETELKIGDKIMVTHTGVPVIRIVETITDDTHLTVSQNFATTASGLTMTILPIFPNG